jgi:hypothetical protein
MPSKDTLVRVLTPILTPLAGALSAIIAKAVPGVNIDRTGIVALMLLGAVSALLPALHYLHKNAKVQKLDSDVDGLADKVAGKINADPAAHSGVEEIKAELEAHKAEIVDAIAKAIHAPPSVDQVAQQVVRSLATATVTAAPVNLPPAPPAPLA